MLPQLTASLDKPSYHPGDTVSCTVRLSPLPTSSSSSSSSPSWLQRWWSSPRPYTYQLYGQLYGTAHAHRLWATLPFDRRLRHPSQASSLPPLYTPPAGQGDTLLWASEPQHILMITAPGPGNHHDKGEEEHEERCGTFSLRLPTDIPPTFRGRVIRYTYTLAVSTTPDTAPDPLQVRLPVRVSSSPVGRAGGLCLPDTTATTTTTTTTTLTREGSTEEELRRHAKLGRRYAAVSADRTLQEQARSQRFQIRDRRGRLVCQLSMGRRGFRIGDVINLGLQFPSGGRETTWPVYQVQGRLQQSEQVAATVLRDEHLQPAPTVVTSSSQCVRSTDHTVLYLAIPPTATPAFDAAEVSVRWEVELGFLCGNDDDDDDDREDDNNDDWDEILSMMDEFGVFVRKSVTILSAYPDWTSWRLKFKFKW
eukprot:gb/GECH01002671.1/.p1 GENE.gb/GECH01002671.1/~~gb/GECH01002671.1/.p1  ORF type:complete len:422 (+),score=85.00 gb/GECH01002671.1/:1-1266(+)